MRRKDKEIIDIEKIEEIIKNSEICRVAFFDEEYPYIVPMNFGYNRNELYFHCAKEGKKIDLINRNNKIAFEIEDIYELVKGEVSCEWTSKYRSVIGQGTIEILDEEADKIKALDYIMEHHGKMENTYNPKHLKNMLALKITISKMTAKESK